MDLKIVILGVILIGLFFFLAFYIVARSFKKIAKVDKEVYNDFFIRLVPSLFGAIIMYALLQINTIFTTSNTCAEILINLISLMIMVFAIMLIGLTFFWMFTKDKKKHRRIIKLR